MDETETLNNRLNEAMRGLRSALQALQPLFDIFAVEQRKSRARSRADLEQKRQQMRGCNRHLIPAKTDHHAAPVMHRKTRLSCNPTARRR